MDAPRGGQPESQSWLAAAARGFVGIILCWAAVAKLIAGPAFSIVIAYLLPDSWRSLWLIDVLAAIVPGGEMFLGVSIFLGWRPRLTVTVCILTLVVFSAALVVLATDRAAPSCGCFGMLGTADARHDAVLGLVRNGALIVLCYFGFSHMATGGSSSPHGAERGEGCVQHGWDDPPRGFTLIELIVVVAIVGVLVALTIPSLSGSRCVAVAARSASNHRQLLAALTLYSADMRESFPFMGTPGDRSAPIVIHGFTLSGFEYFNGQQWHWASLILPDYFDAPREAIEPPGMRNLLVNELGWPETIVRSDYLISYNTFTAPEFWTDWAELDVPPDSLYRGGRWPEVTFPSAKGILIDVRAGMWGACPTREPGLLSIGVADGSARRLDIRTIDLSSLPLPPGIPAVYPVWATRDGLRGRDF